MRSPTTYYQIVYPDMSVSRAHCDCEFTSLLAIKEAKFIKMKMAKTLN